MAGLLDSLSGGAADAVNTGSDSLAALKQLFDQASGLASSKIQGFTGTPDASAGPGFDPGFSVGFGSGFSSGFDPGFYQADPSTIGSVNPFGDGFFSSLVSSSFNPFGSATDPFAGFFQPFTGETKADQAKKAQAAQAGVTSLPGGDANWSTGYGLAGVQQWTPDIQKAAQQVGVPWQVIASIMGIESGGQADAGSPQGAYGLMQVVPKYHAQRAGKYGADFSTPYGNIVAGADYLKELYNQELAAGVDPNTAWTYAAGGYLTGDAFWWKDGNNSADAFGSTGNSYSSKFQANMNALGAFDNGAAGVGGGPGGGAPNSGNYTGTINTATQFLGKPYVFGGADPNTSFDCSGLVQYSFKQNGISLPRTAQEQYNATQRINSQDLRPGDLVFFTGTYNAGVPVTHVGIYVGNGMMIDAQNAGVVYDNLSDPYWQQHLYGYGRVA